MREQNNEETSFFEHMSDVIPLKPTNTVAKTNNKQQESNSLQKQLKRAAIERQVSLDENGLSIEYVQPVDPLDYLMHKQDGVQEGVYKNLRLGKYAIDTRLVLRGLKFDDARMTLYDTISDCHKRGIRTVLVDHGIGQNSKPFPAFLKSYVNQWLQEMDAVIAFHTALKQHGGLGCTYVLIKKSPMQKQINRELHQKRG